MPTKVYAPNRSYSGVSAGVQFKNGEGSTDNERALDYFRKAGYGVGEMPAASLAVEAAAVKYDERAGPVRIGEPLRDAAVEPREKDFLAPTNAGLADPHGPLVVSPGLHAGAPGPIRPGPVAVDDLPRQNDEETELAEAVFVDHQLVPDATAHVAAEQAQERAAAGNAPAKSATKADWVAFAVGQGMDRAEAEDTTKADLQARFGDG